MKQAEGAVMSMILGIRFRLIRHFALAGLASALITTAAFANEGGFETFEPRPTQEVIPADMIAGPHYHLAPTVRAFGYLNYFVTSSDYGTFVAPSDAMLRRLIRDIHAISVLQ